MKRMLSQFFKRNKITWFELVALLAVALIFVFFRWWQLESSLYFYNDAGRDLLVLLDFWQTGKPPLLGPQTSVIPFNQSALYFYLLFPFFVISGQSPFTATLAVNVTYLVGFFAGWWLLVDKPAIRWVWTVLFGLIAIQPEFVAQQRAVWNPSFVAISLLAAFIFWMRLKQDWNWKWLVGFGLTLSSAVAFSYSVVPVVVGWGLLSLLTFWKKWWLLLQLGLSVLIGSVIVNLPTVAFEVRHGFLLTKAVFERPSLGQASLGLVDSVLDMMGYFLPLPNVWLMLGLFLLISGLVCWARWVEMDEDRRAWFDDAAWLVVMSSMILVLAPIRVEAHYIFGVLTFWLVLLAAVKPRFWVPLVVLAALSWLQPAQLEAYFQPAVRTVADLEACAALVCAEYTEPLFVSNQSSRHPFHNAQEFRYFFRQAGCQVRDLDTQNDQASYMTVVLDDSTYTHGQTAFNELTQFGTSVEIERLNCPSKIEVVVLERSSAAVVTE